MIRWLVVPVILGVLAADAVAQDRSASPTPRVQPTPDVQDSERFALQPSHGGVVRVDRRTGAVSFCKPRDAGWTCTLAADERQALEAEIARLQARVAALEKGGPQAKRDQPQLRLLTDEELRQGLDHVGKLMRRFMEALEVLRDKIERSG